MTDSSEFFVRFWGVRGSIACPGPKTVRYGGNTPCVEIRCGDHLLIFDAGTGLRELDQHLLELAPIDADIFLTHSHFDHICGFPFFTSAFTPGNRFDLYAGHLYPERTLKDLLCDLMSDPVFPVPVEIMKAEMTFHDFAIGDVLAPRPGITVRTGALNHPNRAVGYRVEYQGKSICYVTDTEHPADGLDQNILKLIEGADIFIYDSMYTEDEYPERIGWGHSTWNAGVALANAAGVKTFVAFHHDPYHDDEFMDAVADEIAKVRPGSYVAREGMLLRP